MQLRVSGAKRKRKTFSAARRMWTDSIEFGERTSFAWSKTSKAGHRLEGRSQDMMCQIGGLARTLSHMHFKHAALRRHRQTGTATKMHPMSSAGRNTVFHSNRTKKDIGSMQLSTLVSASALKISPMNPTLKVDEADLVKSPKVCMKKMAVPIAADGASRSCTFMKSSRRILCEMLRAWKSDTHAACSCSSV